MTRVDGARVRKFTLGPNQTKWLKALESGVWKQCREALRTKLSRGFAYCCLGVANEACGLGEIWDAAALSNTYHLLGLRSGDGRSGTGLACLTGLNDAGKSFAEIAAILRAKPEAYFTEPK